jgi:hypothetical protein
MLGCWGSESEREEERWFWCITYGNWRLSDSKVLDGGGGPIMATDYYAG